MTSLPPFATAHFTGHRLAFNTEATQLPLEGFVSLKAPTSMSPPAEPLLVNAQGKEGWYRHVHAQGTEASELGLNFVHDVVVTGFSAVFRGDVFLAEPGEQSDLLRDFTLAENLSADLLVARQRQIDVDRLGLVIAGPGYRIWGHWLIDYLPRLALAQAYWGRGWKDFVIPLPSDTPKWVFALMEYFCGIGPDNVLLYDRTVETLRFAHACVPSFVHDKAIHPFIKDIFALYLRHLPGQTPPRICVSRRRLGPTTSVARSFTQADYFEDCAVRSGYVAICPEEHSFRAQLDLFHNATHVVGEFGSGMHNALFAPNGAVVGQFCMPNVYQSRIAVTCGHRSAFLFPDDGDVQAHTQSRYSVHPEKIEQFFQELATV